MGMSYETRRSLLTVKTLDQIALNDYKKSAHRHQSNISDTYAKDASDPREAIYLKLLQGTSELDEREIFQGAPAFFKKKIGLKETGFISKNSNHIPVDVKAQPSKFRLRTCTGCSSSAQIQQDSGDAPCYKRERSGETLSRKSSKREFKVEGEEKFEEVAPVKSFHSERSVSKKPEWKPVWNKPSNPVASRRSHHADLAVGKSEPNNEAYAKSLHKPKPKEIATIFVVNGNVVSLPGAGQEHFTNWFAQANFNDPMRGRRVLKKLDFSGFSNREISLKLFEGRKFVIEGIKPGVSQKGVKHAFKLPEDIEVESLFLSRTNQGYLIIEKKRDTPASS